MIMTHIDNGFYRISTADATKLATAQDIPAFFRGLPKHGYEKLVTHDNKKWWLCRTILSTEIIKGVPTWVHPKQVWSIHEASSLYQS